MSELITGVKTPEQIQAMREGGKILARVFADIRGFVHAGQTKHEIDNFVAQKIVGYGAEITYKTPEVNFPGAICISVNDEIVHGAPNDDVLQKGDVASFDLVITYKGMKTDEPEKDQWKPWEVSYSLRTVPNGNYTKQMNAILGVVIPDETGTYDWYYKSDLYCKCTTHFTSKLFKILQDNSFNIKKKQFRQCNGKDIYTNDEPSFFKTVKWDEFMRNHNYYIEKAIEIKNNKDAYDVHINLD